MELIWAKGSGIRELGVGRGLRGAPHCPPPLWETSEDHPPLASWGSSKGYDARLVQG